MAGARSRIARQKLWQLSLLALLCAASVSAEPIDLHDRRARPVRVALEQSPPQLPAQLDCLYSEPVPAWLEPGPGERELRIRVAGGDVERLLADFDPVPGSFGEFVWTLDADTGDVISAVVAGRVNQSLDWGLFETRVQANIEVRMTTLQEAGFLPPRTLLGRLLFDHCGPEDAVDRNACRLVPPRPYDAYTGYVNAVGSITAHAAGIVTQTYSPLGEVVFSEMPADTAVSAR